MEVLFTDINNKTLRVGPLDAESVDDLRSTLNHWYKYDLHGPNLTWMFKRGYFYINNYNKSIIPTLKSVGFDVSVLEWENL